MMLFSNSDIKNSHCSDALYDQVLALMKKRIVESNPRRDISEQQYHEMINAALEHGIVAGQSVASAVMESFGLIDREHAQYKDIDIFVNIFPTGAYRSGYESDALPTAVMGDGTYDFTSKMDHFIYGAQNTNNKGRKFLTKSSGVNKFKSRNNGPSFTPNLIASTSGLVAKDGYSIKSSMVDDEVDVLNWIACSGYNQMELTGSSIIRSFDINCCQAAIDVRKKTLFVSDEFIKMLDHKNLEVGYLGTPMHTAVRLMKKSEQFPMLNLNIDNEMIKLQTSAKIIQIKENNAVSPSMRVTPGNLFSSVYEDRFNEYAHILNQYFTMESVHYTPEHCDTFEFKVLRPNTFSELGLQAALRSSDYRDLEITEFEPFADSLKTVMSWLVSNNHDEVSNKKKQIINHVLSSVLKSGDISEAITDASLRMCALIYDDAKSTIQDFEALLGGELKNLLIKVATLRDDLDFKELEVSCGELSSLADTVRLIGIRAIPDRDPEGSRVVDYLAQKELYCFASRNFDPDLSFGLKETDLFKPDVLKTSADRILSIIEDVPVELGDPAVGDVVSQVSQYLDDVTLSECTDGMIIKEALRSALERRATGGDVALDDELRALGGVVGNIKDACFFTALGEDNCQKIIAGKFDRSTSSFEILGQISGSRASLDENHDQDMLCYIASFINKKIQATLNFNQGSSFYNYLTCDAPSVRKTCPDIHMEDEVSLGLS